MRFTIILGPNLARFGPNLRFVLLCSVVHRSDARWQHSPTAKCKQTWTRRHSNQNSNSNFRKKIHKTDQIGPQNSQICNKNRLCQKRGPISERCHSRGPRFQVTKAYFGTNLSKFIKIEIVITQSFLNGFWRNLQRCFRTLKHTFRNFLVVYATQIFRSKNWYCHNSVISQQISTKFTEML